VGTIDKAVSSDFASGGIQMIARNIDRLSSPEGAPSCGLSRHKESELLFTIWLRPTAALVESSRSFGFDPGKAAVFASDM
jgi:hypothetical protein